jgi:hypothetical protein
MSSSLTNSICTKRNSSQCTSSHNNNINNDPQLSAASNDLMNSESTAQCLSNLSLKDAEQPYKHARCTDYGIVSQLAQQHINSGAKEAQLAADDNSYIMNQDQVDEAVEKCKSIKSFQGSSLIRALSDSMAEDNTERHCNSDNSTPSASSDNASTVVAAAKAPVIVDNCPTIALKRWLTRKFSFPGKNNGECNQNSSSSAAAAVTSSTRGTVSAAKSCKSSILIPSNPFTAFIQKVTNSNCPASSGANSLNSQNCSGVAAESGSERPCSAASSTIDCRDAGMFKLLYNLPLYEFKALLMPLLPAILMRIPELKFQLWQRYQSRARWQYLPKDLFVCISPLFTAQELILCSRINHHWSASIHSNDNIWSKFQCFKPRQPALLAQSAQFSAIISSLANFPIKRLDLSLSNLRDKDLQGLSQLKNKLLCLNLSNCYALTNCAMCYISKLTDLHGLDLSYCAISDISLAPLRNLTKLTRLNLLSTNTTDAVLEQIQYNPLQSLSISCKSWSSAAFLFLAQHFPSLSHLELDNLSNKNVKKLKFLAGLSSLNILEFSCNTENTENQWNFDSVGQLKQLEALVIGMGINTRQISRINGNNLGCSPMENGQNRDDNDDCKSYKQPLDSFIYSSPNRFQFLRSLSNLATLQLDRCPVLIDEDLAEIGKLSNLTYLQLQGSITNAGLHSLTALPKLEHLTLTSCKISCPGYEQIAKIQSLKRLELHYAQITATGLSYLSVLPKLQALSLDYLSLCDSSVLSIINFPRHLREIYLNRISLSRNALNALMQQQHRIFISFQCVDLSS